MGSDVEVKQTVEGWCSGLAADFYDAGIQKLVTRCDKWLNHHKDYAENLFNVCCNDAKYIFFNVIYLLL
jgi:hypothetical protein